MKHYKKALKILVITIVIIYFIGNVLPNFIGVPIAAYQSYQDWKEISEYNKAVEKKLITSDPLLISTKPKTKKN